MTDRPRGNGKKTIIKDVKKGRPVNPHISDAKFNHLINTKVEADYDATPEELANTGIHSDKSSNLSAIGSILRFSHKTTQPSIVLKDNSNFTSRSGGSINNSIIESRNSGIDVEKAELTDSSIKSTNTSVSFNGGELVKTLIASKDSHIRFKGTPITKSVIDTDESSITIKNSSISNSLIKADYANAELNESLIDNTTLKLEEVNTFISKSDFKNTQGKHINLEVRGMQQKYTETMGPTRDRKRVDLEVIRKKSASKNDSTSEEGYLEEQTLIKKTSSYDWKTNIRTTVTEETTRGRFTVVESKINSNFKADVSKDSSILLEKFHPKKTASSLGLGEARIIGAKSFKNRTLSIGGGYNVEESTSESSGSEYPIKRKLKTIDGNIYFEQKSPIPQIEKRNFIKKKESEYSSSDIRSGSNSIRIKKYPESSDFYEKQDIPKIKKQQDERGNVNRQAIESLANEFEAEKEKLSRDTTKKIEFKIKSRLIRRSSERHNDDFVNHIVAYMLINCENKKDKKICDKLPENIKKLTNLYVNEELGRGEANKNIVERLIDRSVEAFRENFPEKLEGRRCVLMLSNVAKNGYKSKTEAQNFLSYSHSSE